MSGLQIHDGGKLRPQDVEMEESVLGNCLLHPHVAEQVADIVRVSTFYREGNQLVFEAIVGLMRDAEPIDILTVSDWLKKKGKLDEAGGPFRIGQLTDKAKQVTNTEYHCRLLEQLRMKRELAEVCYKAFEATYDETIQSFEIHELLDTKVSQVMDVGTSKESNMQDLTLEIRQNVIKAGGETGLTGSTCGLDCLNRVYGGRQDGDLIISAARPGMGKTGKLVSEALASALDGIPVAIFSLEMPKLQLAFRFAAQISGINLTKIIRGGLSEAEWVKFDRALSILEKLPIYIYDDIFDVTGITTKLRVIVRKYGIKKAFIDHLGWIQLLGFTGNKSEKVGEITKAIKKCCKILNIPVILLSQLNRGVESRGGDKRPSLADLRDSGAIEEDADVVEFLYRPEYYNINAYANGESTHGIVEIIIAKHRNGSIGTEKAEFIDITTKFVDLGGQYSESEPEPLKPNTDFEDPRLPYKDSKELKPVEDDEDDNDYEQLEL